MRLLKIIVLLFFFIGSLSAKERAVQGVLDLRNYDFSESDFLELGGEWEFYPDTLISPKDFWNDPVGFEQIENYEEVTVDWGRYDQLHHGKREFGVATYRLTVLFPDSFQKQASLASHQ